MVGLVLDGHSLKFWSEVIDNLPNATLVISTKGIVTFANQEAVKLLSTPLEGERWSAVIKRSFQPQQDDGLQVSLRNGRKIQVDLRSLPKQQGQVISLIDLTSTREFERAREREVRLAEMGRMLAELAHQIRTPLQAATLYGQNLKNPKLTEEKKLHFLEKLNKCHSAIETQIKDLLLFVKGGESALGSMGSEDFLTEISLQLASNLQTKDVKFILDNQIPYKSITAHLESLKGAICNLVDNAINANATKITLSVELYQDKILSLTVTDNGMGMSEEVLKKSCLSFYTTRAKGTGLGLSVVEAVAKAHNGYLDIKSKEKKGTTIRLFIPFIEGRTYEKCAAG